jgi:hypothetical protein
VFHLWPTAPGQRTGSQAGGLSSAAIQEYRESGPGAGISGIHPEVEYIRGLDGGGGVGGLLYSKRSGQAPSLALANHRGDVVARVRNGALEGTATYAASGQVVHQTGVKQDAVGHRAGSPSCPLNFPRPFPRSLEVGIFPNVRHLEEKIFEHLITGSRFVWRDEGLAENAQVFHFGRHASLRGAALQPAHEIRIHGMKDEFSHKWGQASSTASEERERGLCLAPRGRSLLKWVLRRRNLGDQADVRFLAWI